MFTQNLQNLKLKKNVATYFLGSCDVPAPYKLLSGHKENIIYAFLQGHPDRNTGPRALISP